ncbi:DNA-binding transcriptional LysR family regulator [Nocardiopsis mwathae]|uniref:DNA-binding transcriptional LysR family regulator n=1 Tax=Nocardiopsis mwathae TaxID=1472723 RepID=A0A7W9YFH1_9ACTN|nr:LysR family transcriptional regulator [Nocardiopsis mwathae]MBB6170521.1 DNA-binding transcriptional LysR family regulator [Nocardiopsis mwathae]
MDLVGACRAFVNVSERGSFTLGASAARIPQPVASRRIAALEKHLGGRLFDRSTRRATLTPFGREMLPSAQRLVQLADAMEHDAERAKLTPLRFAVPDICSARDLAHLDIQARELGIYLDFHPAPPAGRAELLRSQQVRMALAEVPQGEGRWSVPLGLASAAEPSAGAVFVETLRVVRTERGTRRRRIWIQPEDDVPQIRDRIMRVRDAVGLQPAQVAVTSSLTRAAAECLGSADFVLASTHQAEELGLYWRPIGEVCLSRSYDVVGGDGSEAADRIRNDLWHGVAECLGAPARREAAA